MENTRKLNFLSEVL